MAFYTAAIGLHFFLLGEVAFFDSERCGGAEHPAALEIGGGDRWQDVGSWTKL